MSLPSGGVRFQDPTLGNASPWIYVWTMWSLTASTGFIALRLWSRRMRFGLDDLLNLAAFAFAVASNATIFSALAHGLGGPVSILNQSKCSSVASMVVSSICLLFVTDFLSKCSTLFLTRRVLTHGASPDKLQRLACDVLFGICVVWIIIALGLLGSDCTNRCNYGAAGVCVTGHRVLAIVVVSIVLEVAIFALPCWLFYNLQMPLILKATTLGLFAIRLPLIAFLIVYLDRYPNLMRTIDDGSPQIGSGINWQLALLASLVIAPSLQALKSTAELFSTSGAVVQDTTRKGSGYRLHDLSSMGSHTRSRKMSRQVMARSESNTELRSDDARNEISILHEDVRENNSRESWTSGKRSSKHGAPPPKMVIHQQMDWDVVIDG